LVTAAVRVQHPTTSEAQVNLKIGAFLAQSADRDGGRKERGIKQSQSTDSAANISALPDVEADDEHE